MTIITPMRVRIMLATIPIVFLANETLADSSRDAAHATIDFEQAATLHTHLPTHPQDEGATQPPATTPSSPGDQINMAQPARRFGEAKSWRLNFGASGAFADNGDFAEGFISASYFIIDDFSIDIQLSGMYFDQSGPDTTGGNFALLLRWHFYSQPNWSIYLDAGAGFLKSSDDVPASGSSFNFTPQAGVGISFDIGRDIRAMIGTRWYHISNADLADSNPGRDHIQFYGGISIPF